MSDENLSPFAARHTRKRRLDRLFDGLDLSFREKAPHMAGSYERQEMERHPFAVIASHFNRKNRPVEDADDMDVVFFEERADVRQTLSRVVISCDHEDRHRQFH